MTDEHLLCKLFPILPWCGAEQAPPIASPEERETFFIFSPFGVQFDPTIEYLVLALVAVKLSKTEKGLEVLRDLGLQYLKTVGVILTQMQDASSQGWFTAMVNQKLAMRVLRRMGLMTNDDFAQLDACYNQWWTIMMTKEGVTDTITSVSTLMKSVSGGAESAAKLMTAMGGK